MTSQSPLGAKSVRVIELTGGEFARVDASDYPRVGAHTWHLVSINGCRYAARSVRVAQRRGFTVRKVFLHREVMNAATGEQVRFLSKDGLDCRKANLSARAVKQWGDE